MAAATGIVPKGSFLGRLQTHGPRQELPVKSATSQAASVGVQYGTRALLTARKRHGVMASWRHGVVLRVRVDPGEHDRDIHLHLAEVILRDLVLFHEVLDGVLHGIDAMRPLRADR